MIGDRIDILIRNKLRMTQRQFAKDIGINETQLSHIIYGRRRVSIDMLRTICMKYNVDANWLLELDDTGDV